MKLAVLGASFLQRDLIEKAKMLGHEVHALAWAKGEVVSDLVAGFHDVSLRDVRAVVERCVALGIEGVTTTSSDVAVPAMAAVAEEMGLKAISLKTAQLATHKGAMRTAFQQAGCAIPRFEVFSSMPAALDFSPPFLVKASDRSGSRGVAVIRDKEDWRSAYQAAKELSFSGDVVIEEYFEGRQFSVEMISDQGEHYFCGLTEEFFDAGDVQANGFQVVEDDLPGQTFTESGASFMGFSGSALLSSAYTDNPKYAIAFTGDGSFMMNPQILIDAVEHGVRGMIALFDNRRMAAITGLQYDQYDHEFKTNDSVTVDYVALAGAVSGVKALNGGSTRADLESALQEAYAHEGLSLIHIPVYAGRDPIGGMGAYGSWNVGNWVEDVQNQYLVTTI